MAFLNIIESRKMKKTQFGHEYVPILDRHVTQGFTLSATSKQSAATDTATRFVRVVSDSACWLAIGSNPTAASGTGIYLPANTFIYEPITGGEKVAVIASA